MKKYCVKKWEEKKLIRKVFEFIELDAGFKVSHKGILDGIMSKEYFKKNFTKVKG